MLRWQAAEAAIELIPICDAPVVVGRGRDVHRQDAEIRDPAALAFGFDETRPDDEPMEPRVEPVRIAKTRQVAPGDDERLLQGVFGAVDIAEDPVGQRVEPVAARPDQVGVRLPVTAPCRLDEIAIHRAGFRWRPSGALSGHYGASIAGCPSIFVDRPARVSRRRRGSVDGRGDAAGVIRLVGDLDPDPGRRPARRSRAPSIPGSCPGPGTPSWDPAPPMRYRTGSRSRRPRGRCPGRAWPGASRSSRPARSRRGPSRSTGGTDGWRARTSRVRSSPSGRRPARTRSTPGRRTARSAPSRRR